MRDSSENLDSIIDAWLLQKKESGETSSYLTFFTREKGVVRVLYKGARTIKKQALLHPFTKLWLTLDERSSRYVQNLECNTPPLYFNGKSLFAALYVNELIYHVQRQEDAAPLLYDAYVNVLQNLTTVSDRIAIERILRGFEIHWLASIGYALSFADIDASKYYRFIPGEGFNLTETGLLGSIILEFTKPEFENLIVLRELKKIMRQAIDHALEGTVIQTRKLWVYTCH